MIAFPAPSSSSQPRGHHRSAIVLGLLLLCLALGLLAVPSSVAPAAVGGETHSRNAYIMVGPGAIVFGEDSKKLEDPCNLAHQARTRRYSPPFGHQFVSLTPPALRFRPAYAATHTASQDWDKFVAKFGVTPEAACHGQAAQKGAAVDDSKKLEDPCNLAHQDWDKFVAKFGVTPEAACHGQAAQKGAAVDTGDVHVGMDAIAVNGVSVGTSGVKAGGVSVTPDGGVDLGGGAGVAPSSPPPVGTEQPWGILLPAFVGGGGDLRGAIKAASAALGGGEDEEGAEGQDEEKPESWYVMVGPGFGAANHDKAE
eukprot:CAMPEP_0185532914 /NCGR_PEP_ID=MMETSP1366-20130426/108184_1 /TAXON_ID=38817 /ORGANISM="Gephyrocapsa oceanica, Strain RCC1303" /LENGTH=310 /DNA_ID=CAMNT_0028144637 /DNA_START=35 /DNA_END=968 /DNA_ORIENTATION=+